MEGGAWLLSLKPTQVNSCWSEMQLGGDPDTQRCGAFNFSQGGEERHTGRELTISVTSTHLDREGIVRGCVCVP